MKYDMYVPVKMTVDQHRALVKVAIQEGLYNNADAPNLSAAVRHLIDKFMEESSDNS